VLALLILFAFSAGLLFRKLGQPPLLGYLLAGFAAHALGIGNLDLLGPIADVGVTMLLFTIGLKLRITELAKPYIFGPAFLHMVVVVPLTAGVLLLIGQIYTPLAFSSDVSAWMLAFALSFSSTVFAIKMFEERGESAVFYASIAIGVLVLQDVLAVLYLVLLSSERPSLYAVALLLVPLTFKWWKNLVARFLALVGHGELQLLFGFLIALGVYELFEYLHLKGGLGALLAGALIGASDNKQSKVLYDRLANFKNLFLIGFFLQIGFYGTPSFPMLVVAFLLGVLVLLRPVVYFTLMTLFRLRARTGWLAGIGLFTYSEFGLIVASAAVSSGHLSSDWLVTLALAIAISFFISTPVNSIAHKLYRTHVDWFNSYQKPVRLAEEEIELLGDANIVILGMGRVGKGVYQHLIDHQTDHVAEDGMSKVIGVEENLARLDDLRDAGFHCVHGDASDRDFWERTGLASRDLIFVSLSNHRENKSVVDLARLSGFENTLAVSSYYEDEKSELEALGCISVNVYSKAGTGFAEHVLNRLKTHS